MSDIKVTPLLGVQDFAQSSALVEFGGKHVLLDCGLNFSTSNDNQDIGSDEDNDSLLPNFSFLIGAEAVHSSIDCVIISHFHLDHCGSLPYLTEILGYKGPIFMTQPTKTIAPSVWRYCADDLRERNFFPDFLKPPKIKDCLTKVTTLVYSQVMPVDNEMSVTVYPSNQPLGPDIFHIDVGSQSMIYVGGCNLKPYCPPPSPFLSHPLRSPARDQLPMSGEVASTSSSSSSSNQHGELTIKMNGCMLSFKIGQSVFQRQLDAQEMQLVSAVFNNLQFMNEATDDEFWQRIAYEMTCFSSPLHESSKKRWKKLFFGSLISCGHKSGVQVEPSDEEQDLTVISTVPSTSGNGKKKKKKQKAEAKNNVSWHSGDLIKFDSPDKNNGHSVESSKKSAKKNKSKAKNSDVSSNQSPQSYTPDPVVVDEQQLLITTFAERLRSATISSDFWPSLSRDLKKKGKITKSTGYLQEYFTKLSNIQLEIMKTSTNAAEAREKWPHFDLLNEIDLSYFFENKWDYRNSKKNFIVTSTNPNKPAKSIKPKQKQETSPEPDFYWNDYNPNDYPDSPTNVNQLLGKQPQKHLFKPHHHQPNQHQPKHHQHQKLKHKEEEPKITKYSTPPEDLPDMLITIGLFSNRLKKTEMSSDFWDLLIADFESINKPINPSVNLQDYWKNLAETQLDVMKHAENTTVAISRWPLFSMLHDLPLDMFVEDKWSYRKLKPRFD